MMPVRIQRKRTKGWKMPPDTVCVARPSKWGNPFRPNSWNEPGFSPVPDDATMAVKWYREDLTKVLRANPDALAPLRGKNLACWCAVGAPCHADVLLELANAPALSLHVRSEEQP